MKTRKRAKTTSAFSSDADGLVEAVTLDKTTKKVEIEVKAEADTETGAEIKADEIVEDSI